MRKAHSLLGLGVLTVFAVSCSLQKWDDVKRNNAGSAGVEQGGGGSGGEDATGGKTSKGGTSAKGGSSSKNTTEGVGATGEGGRSHQGGTSSLFSASNTGGTSTNSGTTVVGAPYVISVSPSNESMGIAANSKIVLTFSEPMDTFSVASALSIPPLANNSFAQVWSADNTTLTITPSSGLSYATGASVASTPPQVYTVNLAASATDAGGTAMGVAYASSFKTLR